ncbi:MAG: DNA polymerase III subunit gamma/tau [Actinomycetota bacterium]|nr:DNA polymerase III subunit gamma/tau [Actinomycetota bacterium]MDK1016321.1 DNA polymerase III subunit gamma/tau [Actinomycetota bacterium]MDK1026860.1 DNA polymerase III subunit gamma/tau [Actinomycetota bacterium]MDK1037466.1 DNA polymerase III subunit gamma/tau [Actinomycetota bacterium]MDK1102099.1 DNA polymerase III subunit gamma/tau [Actinomycetota bacterium]
MQYQALYRKYRPQRFDEVIGQDHVTETLAREVIENKVAHAYLFSGPRGTGKTTSARLLAKSLNCPNRADDGEPCNECPSCEGITTGTSLDVIELDAASHNKVEDIREIRMNVGTVAAADGARRVYILDEAHMLSRAASNALLKTLEEPPEHVVFVLATTQPYKLLDTIRSRTQRFDFHPVASDTLIEYLGTIAGREGFAYDDEALRAVTKHAEGSVRDAMSLLEQVAALGGGEVTAEGVARTLGVAQADSYGRLLDLIAAGDAAGGLMLVAELSAQGADLRRFVGDAIAYFRGVFLIQYTDNIDDIVNEPAETIDDWRLRAASISSNEVLRAIDELSTALLQLRAGREERLVVELAILRLTRPETVPDLAGINVRLDRAERQIRALEQGAPARTQNTEHRTQPAEAVSKDLESDRPFESVADDEPMGAEQDPKSEIRDPTSQSKPTGSLVFADFERAWPAIAAEIRADLGPRRHALLKEARPATVENGTVVFEIASHMHFHLEQLKADTEIARAIASAGAEHLGMAVDVAFRPAGESPKSAGSVEERAPDKDDLMEAPNGGADDPEKAVLDILGGEIVGD